MFIVASSTYLTLCPIVLLYGQVASDRTGSPSPFSLQVLRLLVGWSSGRLAGLARCLVLADRSALPDQAGAHGPALPALLADRSAFAGVVGGWAGMATRENEKGDAMREGPTDRRSRPARILYALLIFRPIPPSHQS